ncbi:MAG TPA: sigma 54-interacting transcriptional regulator [Longimicrobium sp.]
MHHTVAVVPVSEAFSDLLPRLIGSAGADHVSVTTPGELADLPAVCAVLVCAGGREAEALGRVRELRQSTDRAIAVVGVDTEHATARRMRRVGADDYFVLPPELSELRDWVREQVSRAAQPAGAGDEGAGGPGMSRLIGASPALREVLDAARVMSGAGSSTVLITGETGTGKDVLAQAIHECSPRAGGRFVEVNCAALPAHLLEAELFGYEKGAFTDARAAKAGLVEVAEGGTLFLDEIGDLPMALQGKLLRFLESRRARRLGALREVPVNARVIAATHVDLAERVREGRFREDLFYRLDVLTLTLPPLRDREGDVLLLAGHFLREFAQAYGFPVRPLAPEVRAAVQGYAWPGNVRQLRNSIERGVILGQGVVTVENLRLGSAPGATNAGVIPFPATMEVIQASAAHAAVVACAGNKSRAADLLGISRKGLYALLRTPPVPSERP